MSEVNDIFTEFDAEAEFDDAEVQDNAADPEVNDIESEMTDIEKIRHSLKHRAGTEERRSQGGCEKF
jgi:hypothetical protein